MPEGPPDDRFVYLSDVLPTAWQAVRYADLPQDGTLLVLGLGPIGAMACRVARHLGAGPVIAVDLVPERLDRARQDGVIALDLTAFDSADALKSAVQDLTHGRGPDSVIDAVGTEAHGSTVAKLAQAAAGLLPRSLGSRLTETAGMDRLGALELAISLVRRGGTISVSGVYGGAADPLPMMTMFDKQVQLRMGQANVRRWSDEILPLLTDEDPLGVDSFATHHVPLDEAPDAYAMFQKKEDGAIKVVFRP